MKYLKSTIVLLMGFVFTINTTLCETNTKILTPPSDPQNCKSAIVMEASTGEIIYQLNEDQELPPASMTKMMLILITMDKVKAGELSMDDIITTSANASRMGGSQVYLAHNEQFPLREMLKAVMIQSANDASMAIAEHIAGSAAGFVDLMNARASELNLTSTTYHSPHGLPPGKNQEPDMTSARDLATLARTIVVNHPEILKWSSLDTEPFRDGKFILTNTNRLVKQFKGCDGLKTGFYHSAGFGVTATAQQDGIRMICVVMGCKNGKERFSEAARLLKWGLMKFKKIDLIHSGTPSGQAIPVIDGTKQETIPEVENTISAIIRKDKIDDIMMKTTMDRNLTAPIEKGVTCGKIIFTVDDNEIGRVDLKTVEQIDALNWWGKLKRVVGI